VKFLAGGEPSATRRTHGLNQRRLSKRMGVISFILPIDARLRKESTFRCRLLLCDQEKEREKEREDDSVVSI